MRTSLLLVLLLPVAALAQTGTLSPRVVSSGTLESGGQDAWTFDGHAGDIVAATLTSDVFDTVLELYGPTGDIVARNDDGGDAGNSALNKVRLPLGGRYRFTVRSRSGTDGGTYAVRMTLNDRNPPPPSGTAPTRLGGTSEVPSFPAGSVQVGQTVTVYLNQGTAAAWTFSGRAGQPVSLSLDDDDGGLSPYLQLLSPSGAVLASDGGFSGHITAFRLPETGTYTVRGSGFNTDGSGPLTLTAD